MRWTAPPAIVAESLIAVPDALLTALHPGPPASGALVASSLARSLAPSELPADAPEWLLAEQVQSFRRVLAALRRYRGALLADPVGSGKTFVALALAHALNRGPTACLIPATLAEQWQASADRVGVQITLCTHEQVSRGVLPLRTRGLVLIDESHHFRNPRTKRYRYVAPWLVGRPTVLITATPIVNDVADLAHQLRLIVRDDVLALDGVSSLRTMLASGCPSPALGQLVFESDSVSSQRPSKVSKESVPATPEAAATSQALESLGRLRFSKSEPIRALIRGILLRTLASSPAAFGSALRRYRRLLLHARDATGIGQSIARSELRRFSRELDDQLVWWELLPLVHSPSEIELSDLDALQDLIAQFDGAGQGPDGKLDLLRDLLADGTPSLVFTAFRDTVHYIRERLADLGIAWCTGDRAGIGKVPMSRTMVLGWFREATVSSLAPRHLVVTDVAAEGLDLQRSARVVHYDLPWTPMRMDQREGRSVRYGSPHRQVEVVKFRLPASLEHRLRAETILARKARLPAAVGLGPGGREAWRWRAELAGRFGGPTYQQGVATVVGSTTGLLAGFLLCAPGEPDPVMASVLWLEESGGWTEAPAEIEARLTEAAEHTQVVEPDAARLREWLGMLARLIRDRMAMTRSRRWTIPEPTPAGRRIMSRLQSLIRNAARLRQATRLAELERALGFVAGGHSAGEATLIERMADASESELACLARRLPSRRLRWDGLEVRLTGLVLFGPP